MNNLLRLESECQILGRTKTSEEKGFIFAQYFNVLRDQKKTFYPRMCLLPLQCAISA